MAKVIGYAAKHSISELRPIAIERREVGKQDVAIEVLFCGVCHSDVHQVLNEWKNTLYPCMPGHEIVGRVTSVGSGVTMHQVGDLVGVGCMVDSCHHCQSCKDGLEQYCENGFLATYNGNQRNPLEENHTYGGYSESIVVREDFVLRIPANIEPAAAAPILCAGVTTYSPMKHWKVGPGTNIGIIGYGGLGQMAVKIARALGARVTTITSNPDKRDDAIQDGAENVIVSTEDKEMEANEMTFDFLLSTIPQPHDINPYMKLLRRDGVCTVVGCIAPLKGALDLSKMVIDRKSLATSLIGSIQETQEVLDFCSVNNIASNIQLISIDELNEAFEAVNQGEIDFRYVIDMSSIRGKEEDTSFFAKVGL